MPARFRRERVLVVGCGDIGLRVARLGNTSVRYEIGIFRNDEDVASAEGHFIHVYVDRATQKAPTPLPTALRDLLAPLVVGPDQEGSGPPG